MTLKDIRTGESCVVVNIEKSALRKRIIDMGVTVGTHIEVKKLAPLGDPIEVSVRGYMLTLRKNEAEKILVTAEK